MFNAVQLIGNLGGDPELRYFEGGAVKATFTVYVNERYIKDGERKDAVHRIAIETWGKTAQFAGDYLKQGSRIALQGALQENTWESEGQKRSRIVVKASRIENLTPKANDTQSEAEEAEF